MINLQPELLEMVKKILGHYLSNQKVVVFGSRITPKVKPHSDLDLCIISDTPLALETIASLREAFSESDLPIRVDLVDWARLDPEFQAVIAAKNEALSFSTAR